MKVRMYRNYDKFPYESDHHGNFNGRMIFTFFRPISGAFDCILVERRHFTEQRSYVSQCTIV